MADYTSISAKLFELGDLLSDLFSGSFGDDLNSVLEQLARVSELQTKVGELTAELIDFSTSEIYKVLIDNLDLGNELNEVEELSDEIIEIIENFDDEVSSVTFDDFDDLESQIDSMYDNMDSAKEDIEVNIKDKLKEIFSVLTTIGGNSENINQVIDDSTFQVNIKSYVSDVFNEILIETLAEIRSNEE